jgi:hypothetical protein
MWNSAVSSTVILKVVTKGDSNLLQRALTELRSIDSLAFRFG